MIQKKIFQLLITLLLPFLLFSGCNTARGTSEGSKTMSEGTVTVGQGTVKVGEGLVTIVQGTVPIFHGIYKDAKTLGEILLDTTTAY